jgi:hypothetical protein
MQDILKSINATASDAIPTFTELKSFIDMIAKILQGIVNFFNEIKRGLTVTFRKNTSVYASESDASATEA